jgi:hypothetical protein
MAPANLELFTTEDTENSDGGTNCLFRMKPRNRDWIFNVGDRLRANL